MVTTQPFPRLLAAEIDGRCQNIRYRQNQFHRLQSALVQNIDQIKDAIAVDSGHSSEEVRAEICLAIKEIRTHYASLDLKKDLEVEYRVANGRDNTDGKRGVGIVYIVPCSHTMFFSVLAALSAAVAAGNCVVLELMKNTMALPGVLKKILPQALDADTFAISEERPDSAFLKRVHMVVQNDSVPFSRNTLSSPTSSRTVALVDRTANISAAAEALVSARFAFGGRSTYSPDVVLVQEFAMKEFVEAIIQRASKYLGGQNGEARQTVVNPRRASSGISLLDAAHKDASARVIVSGSEWGVVEVLDRRKSSLLQRKVSEKVLVLHPVTSLDDAIDFSNSLGTLAATYAFAAPAAAKYLTQFIDSYSSWVNHVPTDLLIGPAYPINQPTSRETRYSISSLQIPRPQFVTETSNTALVREIISTAVGHSTKSNDAWREALAPLPPIGQAEGKRIGFFEQGIITGGVITLFSLVATLSTLGIYGYAAVRRLGA
ncbi:aldehyde dehydrogenase PutA [Aspergillus sclerotioniger CBS 115572]|uniref:Aldehyde dehydrogenase PutA n=1 Tax=Aspergillus sclerotioniger CBS 115572 TaxID=1450535 RepID=A0A317XC34_9EURO|nr:aldehyde dehydrogenase PutA [Aspergillus sclerotioniger CBS 115572]PWY96204.1 aldehyde dehydrogenase PutA [Aspergillus sclerotioniger CBS 115572]